MNKKIEITNLHKEYKGTYAVKGISFTAQEGKITAFLGPNGAGKSTTLRILLGLDKPTQGQAKIGGTSYQNLKYPLLEVGASFDGVGAPGGLTVGQHLEIVAASNNIKKSKIDQVLDETGITHKKKALINSLSLGEGQRLGIARALLGDPQYLVFDEPTNGLDPSGIRWFRKFIKNQAEQGKTVLLSSHILGEVEAVTDYVVIINKGQIISQGTNNQVVAGASSLEEKFLSLVESGAN